MAPKWYKNKGMKEILDKYRTGSISKDEALTQINDYADLLETGQKIQGINTDVQTSGIAGDVSGITDAALQGRVKAHQINPNLQIQDLGIGQVPRNVGDPASINQMDIINKTAYDGGLKSNTAEYLVKPQLRHQFNMGLMNNIADGLLFFGL